MDIIENTDYYYLGQLNKAGKRHGLGLSLFKNGVITLGQYDDGELRGFGAKMFSSGQICFGELDALGNIVSKRGLWYFAENQYYYFGNFIKGVFAGEGWKVEENLNIIRSYYQDDKRGETIEAYGPLLSDFPEKPDSRKFGLVQNVKYHQCHEDLGYFASYNDDGVEDGLEIIYEENDSEVCLTAGVFPNGIHVTLFCEENGNIDCLIGYGEDTKHVGFGAYYHVEGNRLVSWCRFGNMPESNPCGKCLEIFVDGISTQCISAHVTDWNSDDTCGIEKAFDYYNEMGKKLKTASDADVLDFETINENDRLTKKNSDRQITHFQLDKGYYIGRVIQENKSKGLGVSLANDGTAQIGYHRGQTLHGLGLKILPSGQMFFGDINGLVHGIGLWFFPVNNYFYFGQFIQGNFEGPGFKIYSDLSTTFAMYVNDKENVTIEHMDGLITKTKFERDLFGKIENPHFFEYNEKFSAYGSTDEMGNDKGMQVIYEETKSGTIVLTAGVFPNGLRAKLYYDNKDVLRIVEIFSFNKENQKNSFGCHLEIDEKNYWASFGKAKGNDFMGPHVEISFDHSPTNIGNLSINAEAVDYFHESKTLKRFSTYDGNGIAVLKSKPQKLANESDTRQFSHYCLDQDCYYIGEMIEKNRQGVGLTIYKNNKSLHLGSYKENSVTGFGAKILRGGQMYFGYLNESCNINGKGIWYFPESNYFYCGYFKEQNFNGQGWRVYSDLESYNCIYEDDANKHENETISPCLKQTKVNITGFGNFEDACHYVINNCYEGYGAYNTLTKNFTGLNATIRKIGEKTIITGGLFPKGLKLEITYGLFNQLIKVLIGYADEQGLFNGFTCLQQYDENETILTSIGYVRNSKAVGIHMEIIDEKNPTQEGKRRIHGELRDYDHDNSCLKVLEDYNEYGKKMKQ